MGNPQISFFKTLLEGENDFTIAGISCKLVRYVTQRYQQGDVDNQCRRNTMTAKWNKTDAITGDLTFEIDEATIKDGLDKAFAKVRGTSPYLASVRVRLPALSSTRCTANPHSTKTL